MYFKVTQNHVIFMCDFKPFVRWALYGYKGPLGFVLEGHSVKHSCIFWFLTMLWHCGKCERK